MLKELLKIINKEDQSVAFSVQKELENINKLILKVVEQYNKGGRLFYIGSGTSGRLGVVDASECPPTFGVDSKLVNGIIAGGDKAIRKSIENAEDNINKGWEDLNKHEINKNSDDGSIHHLFFFSGSTGFIKKQNETAST